MDTLIYTTLNRFPLLGLLFVIAISLFILSKGADILVDEAVSLSIRSGIPKMIIGATIVSLGTTLPEATVSVVAAMNGNPDLALGNAIGSIITDTGLILGLAAIIGTLTIDKQIVKRQGVIQIAAVLLLTLVSLPIWPFYGVVHQWVGWVLLALLAVYLYVSMKWSKASASVTEQNQTDEVLNELFDEAVEDSKNPIALQLVKIIFGIALVIGASKILIPSVEISAVRVGIPQSIIAATLVAFGTSLPELITAITAVRKGHGELAIGNIVGADILNVLFVVGGAAAVTPQGLSVPENFYLVNYPAMILIVLVFRIFSKNKKGIITKAQGIILTAFYGVYLLLSYL